MTNETGTDLISLLRGALGIDEILKQLERLKSEISKDNEPTYYNLKAACERKGISYNSAKSNLRLQPNLGKEDCRISGRRMWRSETIRRWLEEVDSDI